MTAKLLPKYLEDVIAVLLEGNPEATEEELLKLFQERCRFDDELIRACAKFTFDDLRRKYGAA
jgi:hypothetical protein